MANSIILPYKRGGKEEVLRHAFEQDKKFSFRHYLPGEGRKDATIVEIIP